jgi:regulator of protease activity HflC (stomatin/prohibitin superfamily)
MRVGLRTVTMDVPPQDVITRDNVSIKVSAVLYFRVIEPNRAITEVQNYLFASSQLAQVTLRSTCGQALLDELLAEREKINTRIQEILDAQTEPWGIKVVLVEVKDIDLPPDMQRAMAKQAEAERERGVQRSFMRRENFKPRRSWRMQPKSLRNTLRPCTSDSCKVSSRYPRKIIPPSSYRCL